MSFMNKIGKMLGNPATQKVATDKTRSVAKDRLSLILASQRGSELLAGVDMEALQKDVMIVVQKHIEIAKNRPAHFQVNSQGDTSIFEMSVELAGAGGRKGPEKRTPM
mmetsp:Transcript_14822/g.20928  ORF Transcript_14822/g.20928 Transcript_14822/m.20928 type:complete len:108 (+) Transcript_14822:190-513(+)